MPFIIVQEDIVKSKADAIVNAANTELKMGGGVSGAIFRAAGARKLQAACDLLAPIKTGEAAITAGFNLPAKFIIHTVGPIYQQWTKEENQQYLRAAYTNALKLAVEHGCESIAFPLISSGIYGYPKEAALQVASSTIQDFLTTYDLHVTLVLFDKPAFTDRTYVLQAVNKYLNERLQDDATYSPTYERLLESVRSQNIEPTVPLEELMNNLDASFSQMLLKMIDAKGLSDVEVYRRANLDRKLFSKIRNNASYTPSKRTAIALAIALELSLDETDALLERAGYALSQAVKFDVIIEYFIINMNYDIYEINEVLFEYEQALLGS